MNTGDPYDGQLYVLALGVLVLAVAWWRRWLSANALARGPRRAAGLGPFDVIAAMGLMLLGSSAAAAVMSRFVAHDGGQWQYASAQQQAMFAAFGQILGGLGPMVYFVWRAQMARGGLIRVGVMPRRVGRDLWAAVIGLLVSLPLVYSVMLLMVSAGLMFGHPAPESGHEMLSLLRDARSVETKLLLAVSAIGLAPLFEEFFYRGLFQTALLAIMPYRRWTIVLGVSALFALVHMAGVPWHALPGLFVLGVILGWLYERTGSLWPSVLVHAGFNSVNFLLALF